MDNTFIHISVVEFQMLSKHSISLIKWIDFLLYFLCMEYGICSLLVEHLVNAWAYLVWNINSFLRGYGKKAICNTESIYFPVYLFDKV